MLIKRKFSFTASRAVGRITGNVLMKQVKNVVIITTFYVFNVFSFISTFLQALT